jgi:hypothetical protein
MDKYNTPCVCSRVQQLLAVLFSGDWDVQYLQDADVCVFRKESLLPRARDASHKMRVLYETATRLRATRDTSQTFAARLLHQAHRKGIGAVAKGIISGAV